MVRCALQRLYRRSLYLIYKFGCWRGRPRPSRLYQRGRPVDSDMPPTERLYFRCMRDWLDDNDSVRPAQIQFPDQSVNRERYSRPRDVLLPDGALVSRNWILWGVSMVQISDLPPDIASPGGVSFSFTAEHDPLEDNYSHSELRVYKNGIREQAKKKINSQVKKKYRTDMAFRTRLVVRPLI